MIRIVTDTASDIKYNEAEALNIMLVSLPIVFEGISYDQRTDEDFCEFYRLLTSSKTLPKTSQPSPAQYLDIFRDAESCGDAVLVITLSSGISGTFNSAQTAKAMSGYDNIVVVDSQQAILTQRMLVNHAVRMRDMGKSLREIETELLELRGRVTVCGVLDTLTCLKKGGRIPPALALLGNALSVKPILIMKNTKLEPLGKVRGFNNGKKFLYEEFEKSETDGEWPVYFGYTTDKAAGEQFMQETVDRYGLKDTALFPIGGVIGTHVGPGCIAIAYVKKVGLS